MNHCPFNLINNVITMIVMKVERWDLYMQAYLLAALHKFLPIKSTFYIFLSHVACKHVGQRCVQTLNITTHLSCVSNMRAIG